MTGAKILAICQSGGEFITKGDGALSYVGGEAHAVEIDREMALRDLLLEFCNMFNWESDPNAVTVKYFLPGNRRTLITVSNDKDLQRMVDFNVGSVTTDVYVSRKAESRAIVPNTAFADLLDLAASDGTPPGRELKRQKISDAWDNMITGVGQVFDDVKDFRDALHKYAISKGFTYKFVKSDGIRATAECTAANCTWRIHASKSSAKQKFVVRKLNDTHTCDGEIGKRGRRLANQRWVTGVIKEKMRDSPDYSPREIVNDFRRDYGINMNYYQAWRVRSFAKKELNNSDREESGHLLWFCQRIMETNRGSMATLEMAEDSTFQHLFVCFHASLHGFEHGCRPLLFLDGVSLKVSRQWKLLVATAFDGENDIFPVAFAVVEDESVDNWRWFLGQLKSVFAMSSAALTFVSNGQFGLDKAVSEVFEDSTHGRCLSHLIEDFKAELEESMAEEARTEMAEHLRAAAYAYREAEFRSAVENIRKISGDAADWVLDSKPELWSNAFFKGLRYDTMSSNAAEAFNTWITKAARKEPTVVQIVDLVRCKLMDTIYTRRESANSWTEILTPSMNQKLQQESVGAAALEVICSAGSVFEVNNAGGGGGETHTVNLVSWECSCRKWQVTGLPCVHALVVIERTGGCVYDYCSKFFKTECHRLIYSLSINPIPDVYRNSAALGLVPFSPRSGRLPGRPKVKPAELQKINKRLIRCSRCQEFGHNRVTCKAPV
ncbi:unnamed protein product [Spirodela intermedia]|uniref:SWIM-type domain-containing protein n=1 Tax=Spirodela intermedia TaxID=51605 RepID=A0A7I8KZ56_SPIIN|nr:unnamed protein product [Spirodela intermedia]